MGGICTADLEPLPRSFGPSLAAVLPVNLGIVTKMGVWLMRRPDVYLSGWAASPTTNGRAADDAMRVLMLDGTIRNLPILGHGLSIGEGELSFGEEGWGLRFALYGREAIVDAQYEIVRESLEAIPGVEVGRRAHGWEDRLRAVSHNDKVQGGIPGMELMEAFKIPFGEDTGHLDLSLVGPLRGSDLTETIATLRSLYGRTEFPYLVGILFLTRSLLHISTLFFDTKDERQTRAAYDAYADGHRDRAGVRRVPHQHPAHGRRRGHVRLGRPRPAPTQRTAQGCARPQRHPLAGQAGDLAEGDAGVEARRRLRARAASRWIVPAPGRRVGSTLPERDRGSPSASRAISPYIRSRNCGLRCAAATARSRKTRGMRYHRAPAAPTVCQRSWFTTSQQAMMISRATPASSMSSP